MKNKCLFRKSVFHFKKISLGENKGIREISAVCGFYCIINIVGAHSLTSFEKLKNDNNRSSAGGAKQIENQLKKHNVCASSSKTN